MYGAGRDSHGIPASRWRLRVSHHPEHVLVREPMANVLPHNVRAATIWNSGGSAYDKVSETIADAFGDLVDRLAPLPGEKCLDVATGTGWTARLLKKRRADVTGVDIGAGVIEAAKKLSPDIDFRVGDAEKLDFPDGSFDVVTSTFGVMFVA